MNDGGADCESERDLISRDGIDGLWALARDPDRLSAAERALLALALTELEERREDD